MQKEKRTVLFIGAGVESVPGIARAKAMGHYVVAGDMASNAPGFAHADSRLVVSTYDVDAMVEAALAFDRTERSIDGVLSVATDVPLTVATVAQALGLPGIPLEAARIAMDKVLMMERLSEAGIKVPEFRLVRGLEELRQFAGTSKDTLVVKPVDSRGARGVLRVMAGDDLEFAYNHALEHSPSGRVIVEKCIEGHQVSTESVLLEGAAYTPGFSDRNYEELERFAPYVIEDGGQQPSFMFDSDRAAISELAVAAGRALGIKKGIVKGDMVLSANGPMVIEIAPRLSGGWFCTDQIPLSTGVDVVGAAIKLALGDEVTESELTPTKNIGVAIRYFFSEPGRVVDIKNVSKFDNTEWVHKLGFFVAKGDEVGRVSNHTCRLGFVITKGATRDEAVSRAREVVEEIHIITEPL
jgi:biotin carboxylase